MVNKPKRKAYGQSRKQLSDLHHSKKKKQESSYKVASAEVGIKHSRVDMRNV